MGALKYNNTGHARPYAKHDPRESM